jgi:hypothetical protein
MGARQVIVRQLGAAVGGLLALLTTTQAQAAPRVSLDSEVFVERTRGLTRSLAPADRLSRGDRVVTILSWQKQGLGGFTVVNPVPRKIAYQDSARDDQEVSVDGGRTWGRLGDLSYGARLATAEDVTHVRWHVPETRGTAGRIVYSAIVR